MLVLTLAWGFVPGAAPLPRYVSCIRILAFTTQSRPWASGHAGTTCDDHSAFAGVRGSSAPVRCVGITSPCCMIARHFLIHKRDKTMYVSKLASRSPGVARAPLYPPP